MNGHICASALYYYDEENITPSYLAFREHVDPHILMDGAEQHREWGLCTVYGIEDSWGKSEVKSPVPNLFTVDKLILIALRGISGDAQQVDTSCQGYRLILAR